MKFLCVTQTLLELSRRSLERRGGGKGIWFPTCLLGDICMQVKQQCLEHLKYKGRIKIQDTSDACFRHRDTFQITTPLLEDHAMFKH